MKLPQSAKSSAPKPVSARPLSWLQQIGLTLIMAVVVWAVVRWAGNTKLPLEMTQLVTKSAAEQAAGFEETKINGTRLKGDAPAGMVWIPGGEFSMGCEDPRSMPQGGPDAMVDARPIHRVYVDCFWMDRTEITNEQFAEFVKATGYVTFAERTPKAGRLSDSTASKSGGRIGRVHSA
jgi:sulfatase modifying factor 1